MSFAFLDHTGDVGFEAEAATLGELITEAVAAFTATVVDPEGLAASERRVVSVTAEAPDLLLHGVLEEVLYRFEVGGFLPRSAQVEVGERGGEWWAEATLAGERRDPARHPVKVLIKGVTYHQLKVERTGEGSGERWRARVIFDI